MAPAGARGRRPRRRESARRRWRYYATPRGRRIVKEELDALPDDDFAEVVAAMREVRTKGRAAGKHLRGDVWEVKADGVQVTYRLLFSEEGEEGQVLLALAFFAKKSRKTPTHFIDLAEKRLTNWRKSGRRP